MVEQRQRSALFKFFYVILSVITFPIFMVMYIFKHPLLVLFLLAVMAGGVFYWPMSQGVKMEEFFAWYQAKYLDAKLFVVAKATESGNEAFIPQALLEEVHQTKEKLVAEANEAKQPKSENYNQKIVRDDKAENTKANLKKRGGFKKRAADAAKESTDGQSENPELPTDAVSKDIIGIGDSAGGLASILEAKGKADNKEVLRKQVEPEENNVSYLPQIEETGVAEEDTPLREQAAGGTEVQNLLVKTEANGLAAEDEMPAKKPQVEAMPEGKDDNGFLFEIPDFEGGASKGAALPADDVKSSHDATGVVLENGTKTESESFSFLKESEDLKKDAPAKDDLDEMDLF